MTGPKERLSEDLKAAMKAGDGTRKDAIRFIQAAIKQVEIDTRQVLTDEQIYGILQTEAKKRRDSLAEYEKVGRDDQAASEQMELALIESYLPPQMTREELEKEVSAAIAESGASGPKDVGSVMKVLMPRVKNKADGKLVNDVVNAMLKK